MPPAPELIRWANLPSTLTAVWLPLVYSVVILALRHRQGWSLRCWLGCVAVGIPLGLSLTHWRDGVGLQRISGFVPSWGIWLSALAGVPQNPGQMAMASPYDRERFFQTTDPSLVAAGVFFKLLIVDVYHTLSRDLLTDVGGAGLGDVLFIQPTCVAGLLVGLRVIVAKRCQNC